MNIDAFFRKFELFADTPNAVSKMRELVLQLAVRGKLVRQDPHDGDADTLLEEIADASRCHGRHKATEEAGKNEPTAVEGWYDVPSSWRWVRLGTVGDIVGGGTPRADNPAYYSDDGIPWIPPADLNGFKDKEIFRGRKCITAVGLENSSARLLPAGTVMFSSRAPIGYVAIAGTDLATNQGFKSCVPFVNDTNEFLYYFLKSAAQRIDREAPGTTFREVSGKIVSNIPIPLPPLPEQKRIVAKVDELMILCDRMEVQQQEREMRYASLTHAAVARFADVPSIENINLIFHDLFTIKPTDLRKIILTLAIDGKLVPQDTGDEPADELLRRINHVRSKMLMDGYPNPDEASTQLRKQNTQILPEGLRPLPPGWAWATLIQANLLVVDCHNKTAPYVDNGIRLLRTTNIRNGRLNLSEPKFVTKETYEVWSSRCKPEAGDILITREAPMGEVCIIPDGMKVCLGQRMMLIRPVPETIDNKFLLYSLMDPALMGRVQDKPVGATVQHLRVGGVETLLTALPPLAEQRRIVARVDLLMALVDQLEMQLNSSRSVAEQLMSAIVTELTTKD
jgi:type I restriction enzyme, S subunit